MQLAKNSICGLYLLFFGALSLAAQEPREISLKGNIESVSRSLNRCFLSLANSSERFDSVSDRNHVTTVQYNAWLNGAQWQIAVNDVSHKKNEIWDRPFPVPSTPFSANQPPESGTTIQCSDGKIYSEFMYPSDRKNVPWRGLHSSWKLPSERCVVSIYLPYLQLGIATPVSMLLQSKLPWEIVRDNSGLHAVVPQNTWIPTELKRHKGVFETRQVLKVEFTPSPTYYPKRIETHMQYRFDGVVYEGRASNRKAAAIFEIDEMRDFGNGLLVPSKGRNTVWQMDPNSPEGRFDPDRIVDGLLEKGEFVTNAKCWVDSKVSWVVHQALPISSGTNLSFVPPDGALMRSEDATGATALIKGLSQEDSDRLLGLARNPTSRSSLWKRMLFVFANVVIVYLVVRRWQKKRSVA